MADIESAIKHIEGSLKSEDNGMCYILQSRLWHIRHLLKKQQEEVKNLKAENERLKQEKTDAVKLITEEQRYEASEMNNCGIDGDDWGYGIHAGKYTAYQITLDIINKPPKDGVANESD